MTHANERVSSTQMLVPMTLMALTMALFFGYQLTQIMRDRDSLHMAMGRIETPYTESQKVNAQFGGLVMGTKKLAEEGNAPAQELVKKLQQIGILQNEAQKSAETTAPVPAESEQTKAGPVKP